MRKQDKLRRKIHRRGPWEPSDDYPFAEGMDTDIDLLVYAEALERKEKDPMYDLLKDLPLVKAMIS